MYRQKLGHSNLECQLLITMERSIFCRDSQNHKKFLLYISVAITAYAIILDQSTWARPKLSVKYYQNSIIKVWMCMRA